MKRTGSFVRLRIGRIPTPLEPADLESKVAKLRAGDETVKEAIILSHIKLAAYIASRYGSNENLISGAFYGLVVGVHNAVTKLTDNNIGPYLTVYMHKYVREELKRMRSVAGARKEAIEEVGFGKIEIEEIKKSIAKSDLDSRILELRLEGRTDEEVAELLGVTKIKVFRIRQLLKERYLKMEL